MNQKSIIAILGVVVIILIGTTVYFATINKASQPVSPAPKVAQQQTPTPEVQQPTQPTPQPNTETPVVEKNVTNQPAYLIVAYSKNGKNYIDVDYVEWLHGDASIKAQVEDGECANAKDCYDYPNGYKRNQNPLVRTFEISPSVNIVVNGEISAEINELENTQLPNPYGRNLSITFNKLKDAVSSMGTFTNYAPPFKAPKAFITIDVKGNVVTKISEPYQE